MSCGTTGSAPVAAAGLAVFARPVFQDHVKRHRGGAGHPDVSLSAAVDGGVVFYYSFCDYSRNDPTTGMPPLCGPQWHIVGGTSEASPLFAGIVAIADQAVGHRLGYLNPLLYSHSSFPGIVDVTSGNNSFNGVTGFNAGPGYDLAVRPRDDRRRQVRDRNCRPGRPLTTLAQSTDRPGPDRQMNRPAHLDKAVKSSA